jgi:SET domain-containing protein
MLKNILFKNPKIEIRRSSIHGWGVFTKEFIKKDELLEEIPFIVIPMSPNESSSLFIDYRFNYPSGVGKWTNQVLPFGFAGLYNHSDSPNAYWYTDEENKLFIFRTSSDIESNSEIFVYYGNEAYWNDGRRHIKIK